MKGCLEFPGVVALLATIAPEIRRPVERLTHMAWVEGPPDFFATHVMNIVQHSTVGAEHFAAVGLLLHGAVELARMVGLLRGPR